MGRGFLYEAIDPASTEPAAIAYRRAHTAVIAAGLCAVMASTVPWFNAAHERTLEAMMFLSLAFFALEYVWRLWIVGEVDAFLRMGPWRARLEWAVSPLGVIDALAVAPMLVARFLGFDSETVHLMGILWVFKLAQYAPGLAILGRVLRNSREPMTSVTLGFLSVLTLGATIIHLLEGQLQPEAFGSVPASMWWTLVTLTTTGYGDVVPKTDAGRVLGSFIMIAGLAVAGLWTGILATGFAEEMRRRQFLRTWDLVAKVPYFNKLGAVIIAEVTRLLRPRDITLGTVLMRKGDPGDCMYFVVSGELEILLAPNPIRLGAGTFIGEIALITGAPRTATVVATRPTTLLALDIADFRELAARHPELEGVIREEAERRLSQQGQPGGAPPPAGAG